MAEPDELFCRTIEVFDHLIGSDIPNGPRLIGGDIREGIFADPFRNRIHTHDPKLPSCQIRMAVTDQSELQGIFSIW